MKPDAHDITERHTLGYHPHTLHEAVCRCGWKAWEETELAATLAWMLHNVDMIAMEASRARHPSQGPWSVDGVDGPW